MDIIYDLHSHSTASDGTLTPTQLIRRAHEAGVSVLALTDHDSTGGIAEALITTATGLCVAIPTLVCYRFLKDKAGALIFEMEESSIRMVELMDNYTETD